MREPKPARKPRGAPTQLDPRFRIRYRAQPIQPAQTQETKRPPAVRAPRAANRRAALRSMWTRSVPALRQREEPPPARPFARGFSTGRRAQRRRWVAWTSILIRQLPRPWAFSPEPSASLWKPVPAWTEHRVRMQEQDREPHRRAPDQMNSSVREKQASQRTNRCDAYELASTHASAIPALPRRLPVRQPCPQPT